MLISVIVESLGPEFLLPPNLPDAKPFLLAINLNSVEVGMIIPFSPLGQVNIVDVLIASFQYRMMGSEYVKGNEYVKPLKDESDWVRGMKEMNMKGKKVGKKTDKDINEDDRK